jgi:hypothetical protein
MKLKNIIPQCCRSRVVRQFGDAKLIRRPNGQHELVGGTDADRADAFEWASLFANEIVFTHFPARIMPAAVRASRGSRPGCVNNLA